MKKINFYSCILIVSMFMLLTPDSYATRYSIDVANYTFSPSNLTSVRIGDTIHFEWKSGSHTTTSTTIPAGAAAWDQLIDATHLTYDYVPTIIGVYHYKCTPHESMGMVGQFTVVNSAGIGDNVPAPKISVYPDPVRDIVNINLQKQEGVFINRLSVYDISGKKCLEYDGTIPDQLDLSKIQEGMIIFEFTDNHNRTYTLRAIRKN